MTFLETDALRAYFLVALFVMIVGAQFAQISKLNAQSSDIVYKSRDKVVDHWVTSDGITKFSGYVEMPQNLHPAPDDKTISFYYDEWLKSRSWPRYQVDPGSFQKQLEFSLKTNDFLDSQMRTSGVLSYLYFEKNKIIYDEIAPQNRFSFALNNNTEFRSNSIGKSIVSYLVGHAICDGYITSVDEELSTWPVLENTLYYDLKLSDLLDMRARDQHVVTRARGFIKSGRWYNPVSIQNAVNNELQGTRPNISLRYNYNGFVTNVVMNYMIFKLGDDWRQFFENIFQNKIGIESRFFFQKVWGNNAADGNGWYSSYANRYDFLRIAISMMEDWNEGNCVGNYLKDTLKNSHAKPKDEWAHDLQPSQAPEERHFTSGYANQFHTTYKGMRSRNIVGMDGYGGQSILIDMDNSRIVAVMAGSTNYNWYELVYKVIKEGKIRGADKPKTTNGTVDSEPLLVDNISRDNEDNYHSKSSDEWKQMFKCFSDSGRSNGVADLPSDEEVTAFISNIIDYDFISASSVKEGTNTKNISSFQLVRLGLSRASVTAHKKALVRLANFAGTAEDFCSNPVN